MVSEKSSPRLDRNLSFTYFLSGRPLSNVLPGFDLPALPPPSSGRPAHLISLSGFNCKMASAGDKTGGERGVVSDWDAAGGFEDEEHDLSLSYGNLRDLEELQIQRP